MNLCAVQVLCILLLLLCAGTHIETLTVDNQLVSTRNDCFGRVTMEAMLPFEKAFSTEDTNSLDTCKEKCLQTGEKCQSFAFGVHRRGNGTCQLSAEKFEIGGSRPRGVIFDPDFDLYGRKTNCFDLSDNSIPQLDTTLATGGYGGISFSPTTPSQQRPTRPTDGTTTVLVMSPTPTTTLTTTTQDHTSTPTIPTTAFGGTLYDTHTIHYLTDRPPTTSNSYAPTPTDGDRLYFSHDIYPLYKYPMLYEHNYPAPNEEVYIPGGYASNVPEVDDRYRPTGYGSDDGVRPTPHGPPPRPIFGLGYGNGYSYGKPETYYPTTSRPYDTSPMQSDRDRPSYSPRPYDRPNGYPSDRPNGYPNDRPNGYPNERPPPSGPNGERLPSTRPEYDHTTPSNYYPPRPDYGPRPTSSNQRPTASSDYGPRPQPNDYRPTPTSDYRPQRPQDGNQRPPPPPLPPTSQSSPPPYASRPPYAHRPGDSVDYHNRPDPPASGGGNGISIRPPPRDPPPTFASTTTNGYGGDFIRRNGTAARPDGGGDYNDDKIIATYFNPDDYLNNGQSNRPNGYGSRPGYPMNHMRACFRRVLAGKRIAPHWVRRTIACERVEECMRECGHEKRFMCEGFNYRLDPSGHGQGDCELIEIPLAKMDLYSSPHQRDSNLLRHPDYDYYERDRNAPSSCRRSGCLDCSKGTLSSPPLYFRPTAGGSGGGGSGGGGGVWVEKTPYRDDEHYAPPPPPSAHGGSAPGGGSYYGDSHRYTTTHHYDEHDDEHYHNHHQHHNHQHYPATSTAIDRYRPSGPPLPPPISYDHRRPPPPLPPSSSGGDYHHSSSYEFSSHGGSYYEHTGPSSSGIGTGPGPGPIDRYDLARPDDHHYRPPSGRPDRWETLSSSSGYDGSRYRPRPEPDNFRPPYRPGPEYSPYRPHEISGPPSGPPASSYHTRPPPPLPPAPPSSSHKYLDRDRGSEYTKYLIGGDHNWGSYGGSYGGTSNKQSSYWGLNDYHRRKDPLDFNYFELGGTRRPPPHESNAVISYPGTSYSGKYGYGQDNYRDRHDYRQQWTRRPGPDECSAKTSEGFRLHKTAVKHSYTVPTITECERLCWGQNDFVCQTYSYRYSQVGRENCMLCDRPVNLLDYYVDIEPDRDYDIYSMADEMDACRKPSRSDGPSTALSDPRKAQCFFRAIDGTRFFKSIVRDSLTARSVGECEMECIKSTKFTCRAFSYRFSQQRSGSIIDNCQLSDWPVRDMDKERHLIRDNAFDVFERASYGHGCEIQPIVDEKHKKFCYLGYGSPAKLLSAAVKKVISVPTERDCKKECIRYRETTSFKCYSFSFGSRATSYNCEMSDLDQTELKLNVHYTHTSDRDYWLFAWNPFDWTCRDKVNTIGGSRVNNDRRMDIFREPGDVAWRHYSVSGKPCRRSSPCEKNLVSGFYSCEIEFGEAGAWDYCCKADHPCGYSQGFAYPWCFVGDELDQWRKCSDRYFPGNHTLTHVSLSLPTKDTKKKPIGGGGGSSSSSGSSSSDYQRPPRPGGLQSLSDFAAARLWPVTYLYSEGPPNSTEFSNFVDCNKESC